MVDNIENKPFLNCEESRNDMFRLICGQHARIIDLITNQISGLENLSMNRYFRSNIRSRKNFVLSIALSIIFSSFAISIQLDLIGWWCILTAFIILESSIIFYQYDKILEKMLLRLNKDLDEIVDGLLNPYKSKIREQ